jgi:two-component system cell cycle sensor histidine kinase/response regulator CckA
MANASPSSHAIKILLVEDSLAEARLLREVLKGTTLRQFDLVHVQRLRAAIEHLNQQVFDVSLLDLTLPDSYGLESLRLLIQCCPSLPIVVLTNTNDDDLALEAVRQGAQDYLVKQHVTGEVLVRSLRYAIERKQISQALQEANNVLELRVQERTQELQHTNDCLKQEIQQRQRIQERLELAQRVCGIGAFEWNIQQNQFTLTAELEALYQQVPGSFGGTYADWINSIHPSDRDRVEQEVQYAIHTQTLLDTEFTTLGGDGAIRWIAARGSVFYDEHGNPLRMLGINTDITDKKQLEAQFLRAQRLESIGTLASGIAHDLNNILTPILAVAQLLPLKLPNLDDHHRRLLKLLEVSGRRGAEIVKQILSFARGTECQRVLLNVGHVLIELETMLQQTLPKSIEIHIDVASDLWLVFGDVTQLQQVLMNLCVNARDAMPHGGHLTLEASNLRVSEQFARKHLDAKTGSYVMIAVSDTGTGIPPEVVDRIFDPFFTTKEVGKGTGLGLSAVIGIVKGHGGFVDVQTKINQGSRFTIYLPATQDIVAQTDVNSAVLEGNSELILVVDDEAAIREVTRTTLESYNYRVITATNGNDAIALYQEHKNEISSILVDMIMPKMDGLTAIPILRQLNPTIPIIVMTGQASKEVMAQVANASIYSFLQKPFTTQELLKTLRQATASL